jgi:hypothetical protein
MSQRILIRLLGASAFSDRHQSSELNPDVAAQYDKQGDIVIITRNLQSAKMSQRPSGLSLTPNHQVDLLAGPPRLLRMRMSI